MFVADGEVNKQANLHRQEMKNHRCPDDLSQSSGHRWMFVGLRSPSGFVASPIDEIDAVKLCPRD
jgi:hypothetical protein